MTEYIKFEDIISKNGDSNSKSVPEVNNKETAKTDSTKMKLQCCRCRPDWFVVDGLGITCSGLTYILILFGEFVVIGVILLPFFPGSPWSYIHAILFSCCGILAGCSHLRAMTTNPGTIPKGNFTDENVKHLGLKSGDVVVRCTRCECIKTERAHHCSTCQRCIRKMDHHCPWINNCVGEFNQKYFVLFTFYIMTLSAYSMALAIHYVLRCSDNDWKGCTIFSPPTTIIFIVFLLFEGLLFGLFTMIMFCTQLNSVIHDETGIEHLKKEARVKQGNWKDRLKDMFGGDFGITWFSPFSSLPHHRKKHEFYDV
ncbi:palmitoyltransferase ZDHHC3-like [Hydra vulgaris]|uniref:Palmitoyltransferase n=1 Tax=Hydra vulgaris TaxID=6087 RepID=A0ABM4DNZ2_HYDVU